MTRYPALPVRDIAKGMVKTLSDLERARALNAVLLAACVAAYADASSHGELDTATLDTLAEAIRQGRDG